MGYKIICTECRTSYSKGNDPENLFESNCSSCGQKMILVDHKFKPPKKSEIKKWQVVKLLVENGLTFQAVHEKLEKGVYLRVNYPKNLSEAKEFIQRFKNE